MRGDPADMIMQRVERLRSLPWWAPLAAVVLVFTVLTWGTLLDIGERGSIDSGAFQEYAETLENEGRLPTEAENYEYWLPPGTPAIGVAAHSIVEALPVPPRPLGSLPNQLRRSLWLLLAAAAVLAFALGPRGPRRAVIGGAVALLAGAWAACYALAAMNEFDWIVYSATSMLACALLLVVTGLIAKELWPDWYWAPTLAALALFALPVVPRIALFFHPDPWLALLTATAVVLVISAARRGWPPFHALAIGVTLGLSALVRPSAVVVIGAVGLAGLLLGRRKALPAAVIAAVCVLGVAGPWWVYQYDRSGNPLQSNLDRPGYMLERQPRSFYISFPVEDLVVRPYRENFRNELLPRFHAELWADWGGTLHDTSPITRPQRVVASTQSVLGLFGDALVLVGLAVFGIGAVRRARRGGAAATDAGPVVLASLFVLAWIAFVLTLIRFPQTEGDPIKSNYLLFIAPSAAIFGLWSARALWRRAGWWRRTLVVWLVLYTVSYAGVFLTTA